MNDENESSRTSVDDPFAALYELFKNSKTKAFRRYDLIFVDGEPRWVRNEMDRLIDEAINKTYGLSDGNEE